MILNNYQLIFNILTIGCQSGNIGSGWQSYLILKPAQSGDRLMITNSFH